MQVPLAPKQSECADESDESEEVVAMQMRDKRCEINTACMLHMASLDLRNCI